MNDSEILKKLEVIENYSKLAAKTVLSVEDVVLLTGLSKSHGYVPFYD